MGAAGLGGFGPFSQFPNPQSRFQTRGPEPEELDAKSRELLTQQAAQCLSKLVQIAPRARRNFILDQVRGKRAGRGENIGETPGNAGKPGWERRETGRETPGNAAKPAWKHWETRLGNTGEPAGKHREMLGNRAGNTGKPAGKHRETGLETLEKLGGEQWETPGNRPGNTRKPTWKSH